MCHEQLTAPIAGGSGLTEELIDIPGEGRSIPTWFVRPEGAKSPGIVIFHDVYGVNPFYQDLARRLAGEGFAVLLPDLFVREGAIQGRDREAAMERRQRPSQTTALADIAEQIAWLKNHADSNGAVGTVGFCMGGTYVLLAASRPPVPHASVCFYGFPVSQPSSLAPLVAIDEADTVASPLLGLWGDGDEGVGMDNVGRYHDALDQFNVPHEFVIYPGLGHGFLTFDPADPRYERAQDAWRKAVDFLREKLAGGA